MKRLPDLGADALRFICAGRCFEREFGETSDTIHQLFGRRENDKPPVALVEAIKRRHAVGSIRVELGTSPGKQGFSSIGLGDDHRATIEMRTDDVVMGRYRLIWIERGEVVGEVEQSLSGICHVVPVGPHWSPMKSFARDYENPGAALEDIRQYFARR